MPAHDPYVPCTGARGVHGVLLQPADGGAVLSVRRHHATIIFATVTARVNSTATALSQRAALSVKSAD